MGETLSFGILRMLWHVNELGIGVFSTVLCSASSNTRRTFAHIKRISKESFQKDAHDDLARDLQTVLSGRCDLISLSRCSSCRMRIVRKLSLINRLIITSGSFYCLNRLASDDNF